MKKVLIVVDMQNDFVDGALGSAEAEAIVPAVCAKILEFTGDIFVTFDTHFEDYLNTSEGRKLPVPHCIDGTDGHSLAPAVAEALSGKRYIPVRKLTFGSVDLPHLISASCCGESFTIELIGLCTDICVVSNALILKAHFPQVQVTVDAACCAGVTPASHKAALTTMRSCQIEIINDATHY